MAKGREFQSCQADPGAVAESLARLSQSGEVEVAGTSDLSVEEKTGKTAPYFSLNFLNKM